jgi:tetratricopeptide (TPR) repeat protein
LLADAQEASRSVSFDKAREILKSAVSLYPNATEAWMSLAEVDEKSGDWDDAYNTWDSLFKLAKESRVRELAQVSLQRVNDERIISRLVKSEQVAQTGDYDSALRLLRDAVPLKPSPRTFDRVRNRYFEILSCLFSKNISSARTTHGWKSIAVANFSGVSEVEGCSIRDRIYSSLSATGIDNQKLIFLAEDGIAALQKASFERLPERDKKELDNAGVDAVVFGAIGEQLQSYFFDVKARQTQPLLAANTLTSIPCFPSNVEAWTRLPNKNATSRGVRIEVWTEKTSYGIGDEVIFHIRSNCDCYVTLLDLQTSGGLYVLFPNAFQKENYVSANRIYSIPASQASFSINVAGPTGVEGVKAIATVKQLVLNEQTGNETFIVARTDEHQAYLCKNIQAVLGALNVDDWDIAEWTFEIKQR